MSTEIDREEMVDYLIDGDFKYIMECANGPELLDSYLGFGFKGYRNFTDEELTAEYEQRKQMEQA